MNADRPIVLIHSGDSASDEMLREGLQAAFPNLGLRTAASRAEIESSLSDTEVLIAWNFPFELLGRARALRWLQIVGAGVDSLRGCELPRGIAVTNIRGVFGPEMAEYALTYMLAHVRRLEAFRRLQAARRWLPSEAGALRGRTVGVAGLGSIGRVIAERCGAFGMEVIGLKRLREAVPFVERVYLIDELDAFLARCDFLVLVMPATRETEHMLTRERFQRLKPGCFVVSIGRGSVMDEAALIEALREGIVAGAALDVFASEPLPASSPLWEMDNVFITPHIAGVNRPRDLLPALEENMRRYLAGEALENEVDVDRGY